MPTRQLSPPPARFLGPSLLAWLGPKPSLPAAESLGTAAEGTAEGIEEGTVLGKVLGTVLVMAPAALPASALSSAARELSACALSCSAEGVLVSALSSRISLSRCAIVALSAEARLQLP